MEEYKIIPKTTVLILNYNGKRYLGSLLDEAIESALNQTYSNTEVIFADNGSVDGSIECVSQKYGDKLKTVALGKNYGFCLGNNLASKQTSPETKYLLFLNPDAVLSKEYVAKLVSLMENDQTIGVAQGLEVSQNGSRGGIGGLVSVYGASHFVWLEQTDIQALTSKKATVLWASGSAMFVRKKLFDKVGGFPPEFFMYYDEIDLGCRILCLGFRTVCYLMAGYKHKGGGTIVGQRTKALSLYLIKRNRWLIVIRYFPRKFLLKSSLAFLEEFLISFYLSFFKERASKKEYSSVFLSFRVVSYIIRNLRRELSVRNSYERVQKSIVNYVIPKPLLSKIDERYVPIFMAEHGLLSREPDST